MSVFCICTHIRVCVLAQCNVFLIKKVLEMYSEIYHVNDNSIANQFLIDQIFIKYVIYV